MTGTLNRKRILLLVALVFGVVVCATALCLCRASEAVYHGKRITKWMEEDYSEGSSSDEWRQAIREVGQASVPTLLSLLQARDSALKLQVVAIAKRQSLFPVNFVNAETKHQAAYDAFSMLGEEASCAVPDLIKIYEEDVSISSRKAVIYSLCAIGRPASNAVPALIRSAASANDEVRQAVLVALTKIQSQPENVIPLFIESMHNPSAPCRATAAGLLKAFGAEARTAVPDLVRALEDPSEQVRNAAAATLRAIGHEGTIADGIKTNR